ncbi:putative sodium-coupled neutral amino acid transporter 11 [Anabrus simplex]|uniref:putative sodium-coupled neutral amino acid transporter 11 n=1 Tax=Anabrus simplex TaxID=316456 RepID=UPI0035A33329
MEATPLQNITAETVAKSFYDHWVTRFGVPTNLVTDQGRQFESQLFKNLSELCGVKLKRTTPYHLQSNGKVEHLHRTIKTAIKAHNSIKWTDTLPTVLLGLRASFREDSNSSVAQMVYGTHIRLPGEFFDNPRSHTEQETFVSKLQQHMQQLRPVEVKHKTSRTVFVHKDLSKCTHVFLRIDRVKKPLQPPYEDPFLEDDRLFSKSTTSLAGTTFNYVNSIIGSGVIGIPLALYSAGFGLGLALLIFMAVVTDYSLILMIRGAHLSGQFNYQGLMRAAFGRPGFIVLSTLQFIYPFIAMISYNIVVGDTITKVLIRMTRVQPTSLLASREFVIGLATIFITAPLCLFRDIANLAKISFLSLVFIAFVLISILIRMIFPFTYVPLTEDAWQLFSWDVIPAIGIMAFAFMCHHNTFLLYESMEIADQHTWNNVTHVSLFSSWIIAAMFGVMGYATFTGHTQGDLLENYCPGDDLMNISRVLFSITVLLTYPIECFVTRDVLESLLLQVCGITHTTAHHVIITLTLVTITCILSMVTSCLGPVLELNGILAAVPLAYVLPAVCYIKLEEGSVFSGKKIPALLLALFGLFVAFCGSVLLAIDFGRGDSCIHKDMPYWRLDKYLKITENFWDIVSLKDTTTGEDFFKVIEEAIDAWSKECHIQRLKPMGAVRRERDHDDTIVLSIC